MKVTVEEKKPKSVKIEYPWIGTVNGYVVLFYQRSCGVVLKSKRGAVYDVGSHSLNWPMEDYQEFQGKITLENGD